MRTYITLILLLTPVLATAASDGRKHDRFPIDLAAAEARQAEHFARLDANADGSVSESEFEQADVPHRDRERIKARMKRHQAREGDRGAEHRGGHRSEHRKAMREAVRKELFAILDTNGDGQLSDAEHAARTNETRKLAQRRALFDRMDQNADGMLVADELGGRLERLRGMDADGDGQVTRAEMRAARAERREQRRAAQS